MPRPYLIAVRGYRIDEGDPRIKWESVGPDVKISDVKGARVPIEPPHRVSLGPHVDQLARPSPDPNSRENVRMAVHNRFGINQPTPNRKTVRSFRAFVDKFIRANLIPLKDSDVPSFDEWLEGTDYSEGRRNQLRDLHNRDLLSGKSMGSLRSKDLRVGLFVKREDYPEFKPPRGINSRSDTYKTMVGPIFKAIEKKVFSLPYFIKKVPVADRPKFIQEFFGPMSDYVVTTDHSKFEAHFTKLMMSNCEFRLYRYMTRHISSGQEWYDLVCRAQGGVNHIGSRHKLGVKCQARRMSGEMCTSLGNGFTNLMLILFHAKVNNLIVKCVVEGDDGLSAYSAPVEENELAGELGFRLKLQRVEDLNRGSFCGQLFDRIDMKVITDPIKVLLNFGWSYSDQRMSKRSHLGLLRAKALSLLYGYPGCPIIQPLALHYLRLTEGISPVQATYNGQRAWGEEAPLHCRPSPITLRTRQLVSDEFGVSIPEQFMIERRIQAFGLGVIKDRLVTELCASRCPHAVRQGRLIYRYTPSRGSIGSAY